MVVCLRTEEEPQVRVRGKVTSEWPQGRMTQTQRSCSPQRGGKMCTKAGAPVTHPCLGSQLRACSPAPSRLPLSLAELTLGEGSLLQVERVQFSSTPESSKSPPSPPAEGGPALSLSCPHPGFVLMSRTIRDGGVIR